MLLRVSEQQQSPAPIVAADLRPERAPDRRPANFRSQRHSGRGCPEFRGWRVLRPRPEPVTDGFISLLYVQGRHVLIDCAG